MAGPIVTSERKGTLPLVAMLAVFAYGAVAALLPPQEWPIMVATALPCAAFVVLVIVRNWHRPGAHVDDAPSGSRAWWSGMAVWIVVIAVAITFQLLNFFTEDRDIYPTLSSLASQAFDIYPVRAAVFGLWLWFGWYVVDR